MTTTDKMNRTELRAACKAAGIAYGKLTVAEMRAALATEPAGAASSQQPAPGTQLPIATESAPVGQPAAPAPASAPVTSDEHACPLCNGDPSNQTWATEGVTCLCHECGRTWSVTTRREVATGFKIEKHREERNGVKRPSAGGKCRAVWDYLDDAAAKGTTPKLADVKAHAEEQGWNIANASIELYQWRKFMGIRGRQ